MAMIEISLLRYFCPKSVLYLHNENQYDSIISILKKQPVAFYELCLLGTFLHDRHPNLGMLEYGERTSLLYLFIFSTMMYVAEKGW